MGQNTIRGHAQPQQLLSGLLASQRMPHALLFCGPDGVGKFAVAMEFASTALLARLRRPAERLSAETLSAARQLPDLHLVQCEEGKREISVQQIRDLIQHLSLQPYLATSTFAVIDNADRMNTSAANALLKTLEEPSPDTFLILVSSSPHQLPETILSRCQAIHFGKLSQHDVTNILEQQFGMDAASATTLSKWADGSVSPLQLDSFLDPVTRRIASSEKLKKHLAHLQERMNDIENRLAGVFSQGEQSAIGAALSFAAEMAAEDDREPYWITLRTAARTAMLGSSEPARLADRLQRILAAESAVKERNANAGLAIGNMMTQLVRTR